MLNAAMLVAAFHANSNSATERLPTIQSIIVATTPSTLRANPESVYPGDAATNSRSDVRGETSRIDAANFGHSGERPIVGLPIETDAGGARREA